MPKATAKGKKGTEKAVQPKTGSGWTASCVGECGKSVSLAVDASGPIRELVFREKGWSALNTPEDGTVSFICPECFHMMEEDGASVEIDEGKAVEPGDKDDI